MTDRIFDVNINFLENCNYNASTTNKNINLPLQKPIVTMLTPINISHNGNVFYYGDIIEIETKITYDEQKVTNGYVDFFYINEDDHQGIEHQINDEPVPVDENGNARARFIPYKDCTIIAKYNGEPYFDTAESNLSQKITLTSIPARLEFTKVPPYYVDPKDDIELEVSVFDHNDNPIEYGIVTFLYYDIFEDNSGDGQEKVIGNPVYLIDGKATINYIPIQYKDFESNSHYNIELIRAIYNYDNNLYGVPWRKYYTSPSAYNSIALLKQNNLNIYFGKEVNGELLPLDIEDGIYVATNEDIITITFQIPGYTFSTDSKIRVYLDNSSIPYYADYVEVKNENNEVIDGYFKCTISGISDGIHYVYGVAEDDNQPYLKTKDGEYITITHIANEDYDINDQIYLQSTESQRIYFNVTTKESDYDICFETNEEYIIINNEQPYKVKVLLSNDNDSLFNAILKGNKCYFECPIIGQTYESIIKEQNNQLYAELEIIDDELQYKIPISSIYDYTFYAYLKTDTYTKTIEGQTYSRTINKHITEHPLVIKVRNNPQINLSMYVVDNTYPGKIHYTLTGQNLYRDNIVVDLKEDDSKVQYQPILNQQQTRISGDISDIECGEHSLQAFIGSPYNIQSDKKIYEISKSGLNISLNYYNNEIITSRNTSLIFGLETENNLPIKAEDLNINRFTAMISKDNIQEPITLRTMENLTSTYVNLIGDASIYDDGVWNICIEYNDDNHYTHTLQEFTITATRYEASFDCTLNANDGSITYQIMGDDNTQPHNGEYVLVFSQFTNANDDTITIISITNTQGICIVENPLLAIPDWQQYDDCMVQINPKNNLINTWKTCTTDNDIINAFYNAYPNYEIQCTDNDIINLYHQYVNNNKTCLFVGYDQTTTEYKQSTITIQNINEEP